MPNLGKLIKKMRKRAGMTQAQWAASLGLRQNTISAYERGDLTPSDSVLLLLALRAESEEELSLIAESMENSSGFQAHEEQGEWLERIGALSGQLRQIKREKYSPLSRTQFLELALEIAKSDFIPNWLLDTLLFWHRSQRDQTLWPVFEAAFSSLRTDLAIKENEAAERRKRKDPLGEEPRESARLMILCPQTKQSIFTGVEISSEEFEQADFEGMSVFCSHCFSNHTWSKKDAFLEGAA